MKFLTLTILHLKKVARSPNGRNGATALPHVEKESEPDTGMLPYVNYYYNNNDNNGNGKSRPHNKFPCTLNVDF